MKQKFSLHYDFGDDWMFTITVQNISETSEKIAPNVIKGKGSIEQYTALNQCIYNNDTAANKHKVRILIKK